MDLLRLQEQPQPGILDLVVTRSKQLEVDTACVNIVVILLIPVIERAPYPSVDLQIQVTSQPGPFKKLSRSSDVVCSVQPQARQHRVKLVPEM